MWTFVFALAAGFAQPPAAPITVAGEFSNIRQTGEHAYGYTVELWREGPRLFGLFLASEGLAGDTPAGMLENVRFEERTGRLSFQAKLTLGMRYTGGKQEPSRDLFEFEGALGRKEIAGSLERFDRLLPAAPPKVERIRLKRQARSSLPRPANYAGWKAWAGEILAFRGPKW